MLENLNAQTVGGAGIEDSVRETVILRLSLEELIFSADMEGMNEHLDYHLAGLGKTYIATDINYRVAGTEGELILVEVTYTPEFDEDDEDEDEDEDEEEKENA